MDTLRGNFDSSGSVDDSDDWDAHETEVARELPPEAIGQDERRMQVRAYNHWAGLLGERSFPSIEDLEPANLPDFGPNSVLLDFSAGIEDPIVVYLGEKLGEECGTDSRIERLSDVPPRSLLSRITDHYLQILANQAPIGFEAEFVNQRDAQIMYRGILLPFSSDDETIDFIYGVINWKEMADQATADELLLEIDQAIEVDEEEVEEDEPHKHHADPVTDWADSPVHDLTGEAGEGDEEAQDNVEPLAHAYQETPDFDDIPTPDFGQYHLDDPDGEDEEGEGAGAGYSFASLTDHVAAPAKKAIDLEGAELDAAEYKVEYNEDAPEDPFELADEVGDDFAGEAEPVEAFAPETPVEPVDKTEPQAPVEYVEPVAAEAPVERIPPVVEAAPEPVPDVEQGVEAAVEFIAPTFDEVDVDAIAQLPADAGLHDCLASARELAETARASEDRSRQALYAAVSRAYDFSIAAKDDPDEYGALIDDNGLTVQERAPMTPVVKLVFGVDYDKTRLTEYAAVLAHAHRIGLERGALAGFLGDAEGGLKGVVSAERRLRKEESGQEVEDAKAVRRALAKKLRALEAMTLDALEKDGPEFGLVMIRRDESGVAHLIGELDADIAMIERAARKLVG